MSHAETPCQWSDVERVENVERVVGEIETFDLAEASRCRNLAQPLLAHARAGAFATDCQRLRHAVVQAGGVSKRAELQWMLDVALYVAVQVELEDEARPTWLQCSGHCGQQLHRMRRIVHDVEHRDEVICSRDTLGSVSQLIAHTILQSSCASIHCCRCDRGTVVVVPNQ